MLLTIEMKTKCVLNVNVKKRAEAAFYLIKKKLKTIIHHRDNWLKFIAM